MSIQYKIKIYRANDGVVGELVEEFTSLGPKYFKGENCDYLVLGQSNDFSNLSKISTGKGTMSFFSRRQEYGSVFVEIEES